MRIKAPSWTTPTLLGAAGAGLLAWYVFGRRPGSADTLPSFTQNVSDQIVAAPGDLIDKAHQTAWGIKYNGESSGLNGYVPWPGIPISGIRVGGPLGELKHTGTHNSGQSCGANGRWFNNPHNIRFYYRGNKVGSIRGDVRALFCLQMLCEKAEITDLAHLGMYAFNGGNDKSHDYGYAIDIPVKQPKQSGHEIMERFILAARQTDMPMAWVSTYADGNVWPMFQMRGGTKTRFSYSRQNHNDHYHLVLPRPNFALPVVKVSK